MIEEFIRLEPSFSWRLTHWVRDGQQTPPDYNYPLLLLFPELLFQIDIKHVNGVGLPLWVPLLTTTNHKISFV